MKNKLIWLLVALLAAGRIFITPRLGTVPSVEGAYEAVSHIFVGFLVLVPLYDWKQTLGPSRLYGLLGIALTLWEGGWFFAQKYLEHMPDLHERLF